MKKGIEKKEVKRELVKPTKKGKKQLLLAQAGGLECTNNRTIC